MKIRTIAAIVVFSSLAMTAGFFLGCIVTDLKFYKDHAHQADRKEDLQFRTESRDPSCEELRSRGIPEITQKGNDFYFVHATDAYFYQFGIALQPGHPPEVYWWGAGTEEALKQRCSP